jgi:hypothetical protein
MDSSQLQHSVIKTSNAEVVAKAVKILAAIGNCVCKHCLKITQEALQNKLKESKTFGLTRPEPEPVDNQGELIVNYRDSS